MAVFLFYNPKYSNILKVIWRMFNGKKSRLLEIANAGQLSAYNHEGFWKCMDAIRDKIELRMPPVI